VLVFIIHTYDVGYYVHE